jgi:hypothetical protein
VRYGDSMLIYLVSARAMTPILRQGQDRRSGPSQGCWPGARPASGKSGDPPAHTGGPDPGIAQARRIKHHPAQTVHSVGYPIACEPVHSRAVLHSRPADRARCGRERAGARGQEQLHIDLLEACRAGPTPSMLAMPSGIVFHESRAHPAPRYAAQRHRADTAGFARMPRITVGAGRMSALHATYPRQHRRSSGPEQAGPWHRGFPPPLVRAGPRMPGLTEAEATLCDQGRFPQLLTMSTAPGALAML